MAAGTLTQRRTTISKQFVDTKRPVDTSVRSALASLASVQAERQVPTRKPASAPSGASADVIAAAALCAVLVVGILTFVLASSRSQPLGCAPISYAVQGSPPPHVLAELHLAMSEIRQRSGVVFEDGEPDVSTLVVTWSGDGVTGGTTSAAASGDQRSRRIGFGQGRWADIDGRRQLMAGTIEVDATRSWPLGIDRSDGLAAVFVHELGHVVGLPHSADPTSFMHDRASPQRPRWTEQDLEHLRAAGVQAGCAVTTG